MEARPGLRGEPRVVAGEGAVPRVGPRLVAGPGAELGAGAGQGPGQGARSEAYSCACPGAGAGAGVGERGEVGIETDEGERS